VIAGQEHDHELGRGVELVPISLAPQRRDMVAHEFREIRELRAALGLVLDHHRVHVARHRRLRVDDDGLPRG
jgi:hypothetical protein